MFEFIRKHLKVVMIAFFPLVLFAFIFVGMDPSMLGQRSPVVARVAGAEITQNDWDVAHRQFADRARTENRELTSAMLDTPQQRYGVLERMVRDQVLAAALRDRHYLVSDAQLARELQNQPEIAALRGADGRLDMEGYRNLLRQNGLTPEMYEANVRYQLAMQQVLGVPQATAGMPPEQANAVVDALFQRRELQLKRFLPADYEQQVETTDAALQAYYDAHQAQFQQPERIDVEYALLDLESLNVGIQVSEQELRQHYENNRASYTQTPERRSARHILYATDTAMSNAQREQAREKANAALARLREDPSQFAAIASAESEDPGTRDAGGDLGFFERGAMVADFDEAVFAMEKDAISDVIATEYGFHIIQLTDIQPAQIPSFDEVHERLAQDVKNGLARNQFIEKAEQLRTLAHEQPDTLQPLADELGLSIQTASGITRQPSPDAPEALQSPAVLQALFDTRATQDRENIDAIDLGGNRLVTARVTALHPAQLQPFEQVREDVRHLYVQQESAKLAQQDGARSLAQWQADADAFQNGEPLVVSRVTPQGLDAHSIEQIMTLPQNELPRLLGFEQADGSYLVVQVAAVAPLLDPTQPEEQRELLQAGYRMQAEQMLAAAQTEAYYETLKQAYKVQIRAPRPQTP